MRLYKEETSLSFVQPLILETSQFLEKQNIFLEHSISSFSQENLGEKVLLNSQKIETRANLC